MSKYTTRNVLICVVPSVILLLSVYWFRKKKKFKINSVVSSSSSQGEIKLDSLAEISSPADTLSDASSFASPESSEKSIRTKMFPLVTLSKDAAASESNCVPASNHVDRGDGGVNASSLPYAMDPAVVDSAASIAKDLIAQVEHAVENLGVDYLSETASERKTYDEDFLLDVLNTMTAENRFCTNNYDVETLIKAVETDSNDSRSSVLDENSLSYVSDDSECRQQKTKDSLSSVLDENSVLSSLCDDMEKSVNCCDSPYPVHEEHVVKQTAAYTLETSPVVNKMLPVDNTDTSVLDNVKSNSVTSPVYSKMSIMGESVTSQVNGEVSSSDDLTTCPLDIESSSPGNNLVPETLSPEKDSSCEDALEHPPAVDSTLVSVVESSSCDNLPSSDAPPKSCLHPADCTEGSSPDSEELQLQQPAQVVADMDISALQMNVLAPLQEQVNCNSSSWSAHGTLSEVPSDAKDSLCDGKMSDGFGQYTYEFELPQELCGRLIGKHGKHVKSIKDRSHANVYIKRHPYDPQLKVVVVEGNRSDVTEALELIRRKYPPSQYPSVTLVKTNVMSSNVLPESLQVPYVGRTKYPSYMKRW